MLSNSLREVKKMKWFGIVIFAILEVALRSLANAYRHRFVGNSRQIGPQLTGLSTLAKPRTRPCLAVALSILLVACFISLVTTPLVNAADPGHPSSSISAGTFESGVYTFPSNLTVTDFLIVNTTTLYVDAITGRVGIGFTSPSVELDVKGVINATQVLINGTAIGNGNLTGSGSTGTLAKWTGSSLLGDSIVSESGSTLTVAGNISMPTFFYIGGSATVMGEYTTAIGTNSDATGARATALGYDADATANYSTAVGYGTNANSTSATAIGHRAEAEANYATALGSYSSATGINTVAIGEGSEATAASATAVGSNSEANSDATALGSYSSATEQYAIALGRTANATATAAIAIGPSSDAIHDSSVALGRTALTTAANQLMVGSPSYKLNTNVHGNINSTGYINATTDVCIHGGNCLSTGPSESDTLQTVTTRGATTTDNVTIDSNSDGLTNIADTFYVNGTTDMVGIGTNTPANKLTVLGGDISLREDDDQYGAIILTADNTKGTIVLYEDGSTDIHIGAGTDDVYFNQNGNVGIGTNNPQQKLVVVGHTNITGDLNASGNITLGSGLQSDSLRFLGAYANIVPYAFEAIAYINMYNRYPPATNTMVGIGKSSTPEEMLDIEGGSILLDNNQYIKFENTTGDNINSMYISTSDNLIIGSGIAPGDSIRFAPGGSNKMTVTGNGDVGIGDVSPEATLEVVDSSGPQLMLTHTDDVDYANFTVDSDGNLTITSSSGNVIIQLG